MISPRAAGPQRVSHVIGFDDAPFPRDHRGDVIVVGVAYAGLRLEGVLSGKVRRDGANATTAIAKLVAASRFAHHVQALLLQGIAFAGFNVIDIRRLSEELGIGVVSVVRKRPDLGAIERALLGSVPGGRAKWKLIQAAGPVEPVGRIFMQRAGISRPVASALLERVTVHGDLPEPVRAAHLIAGGMVTGESRHRP